MINAWWLVFIIPMSAAIGAALMAFFIVAKAEDYDMELLRSYEQMMEADDEYL